MLAQDVLNILKKNRIDEQLLREFIFKGLWKPSIKEIEVVIIEMKRKIEILEKLRARLEEKANESEIK